MSNDKVPERIWLSPAAFLYTTKPSPTYLYDERRKEETDIEYVRADLLATVRKEEREAAFRTLCCYCAEGDEPTYDKEARWYYHGSANQEVGCSSSKLRIAAREALANSEKER